MANLISWKKSTPIPVHIHHRNPFLALQTELDQAMNDFYRMLGTRSTFLDNFENLAITPSIDLVDDKDHFKVEAEMPGLSEEDVKVSIGDGMLTIKGEKTTSKKDEGKNYISREINYGSYERTIALPDSVDIEKAEASFKKGMLWITIPKKAGASQRSREIKVEKAKN